MTSPNPPEGQAERRVELKRWQRVLIWLGLPPMRCPDCGKGDTWTRTTTERGVFLNRPKILGPGWECGDCGWKS